MRQKIKLTVLAFQLAAVVALVVFNFKLSAPAPKPVKVLARETVQPTESPTPMPKTAIVEALTRRARETEPLKKYKKSYVIAFVGDSMVETMGPGLPYVYRGLKNKYPGVEFSLYNYGIGSENIVEGISRFGLPYAYKGQKHEPLSELGADIIVVGSYSYNPIVPFDKNEAWLLLSDLVGQAKQTGAKVYILAEQAPIKDGFGKGPGGVNWPEEIAGPHVDNIVAGLKNALALGEALEVRVINIFGKSLLEDSEYGNPSYVTKHDGVHYSEAGMELTAKVITETIELP